MKVIHGLHKDKPIDLIVHSPGGTAEAAEAIISYLRGRFSGIRVIVPVAAMSAATMLAMAADEIVMADHSQLGPIDPQLTIATPEGPRSAPAEAIRAQFKDAQKDLAKRPEHTAAWLPILRSYAPALLKLCEDASNLSKTMVTGWLGQYMFADEVDGPAKAKAVADYLSNYSYFKSHSRRVDRDDLRQHGVVVADLESDQKLQDLVLSVHHAINHVMSATGVVKLVENHLGKAYIRRVGMVQVPVQGQQKPNSPSEQAEGGPPLNRQQRRQQARQQRKQGS